MAIHENKPAVNQQPESPLQMTFDVISAPRDMQLLYMLNSCLEHFRKHMDVSEETCRHVLNYLHEKYNENYSAAPTVQKS